jgi:hypothetical protein
MSNKEGNTKAFELTRAFLGYEYHFSKNISSKLNIDLADPGTGELKMTAVIRNAYKFGPPSDLGVTFKYSPAKIVSFDLSVLNGEGYKKVQLDSIFKTTSWITLKPFSIFIRYDYLKSDVPNSTPETGDIIRKDGQLFIAGFDYSPVKGVKISPSYFGYAPDDKSLYFTSRFGLYFEVKF